MKRLISEYLRSMELGASAMSPPTRADRCQHALPLVRRKFVDHATHAHPRLASPLRRRDGEPPAAVARPGLSTSSHEMFLLAPLARRAYPAAIAQVAVRAAVAAAVVAAA